MRTRLTSVSRGLQETTRLINSGASLDGIGCCRSGRIIMKMFWIAALCLVFSATGLAQTADTDPATADQVELLLRTMHSHAMTQRTRKGRLKPMDQMFHDQSRKDGKKVPADFEPRFTKMMNDMLTNMPWEQMTQATVPVYQKDR